MTYGPPVIKQCEHCKKEYKCPNSRAHKSRFCTITCHNKSGLLPRIEYTCVNCDDKFMARPDHGEDRKFCSRKCFLDYSLRPEPKECENCGGVFLAGRSATATRGDGRRIYCSKKCYTEGSRSFEERPCVVCGKLYYPLGTKKDKNQKTCSLKCMAVFFSGPNGSNWQGGEYISESTNHKMVLIGRRKGYVGKYTAEHRLVVAKYIGRLLERDEVVLHINSQPLDNRPSNLFLCETRSEYGYRRHGSLPWPTTSNLDKFKETEKKLKEIKHDARRKNKSAV